MCDANLILSNSKGGRSVSLRCVERRGPNVRGTRGYCRRYEAACFFAHPAHSAGCTCVSRAGAGRLEPRRPRRGKKRCRAGRGGTRPFSDAVISPVLEGRVSPRPHMQKNGAEHRSTWWLARPAPARGDSRTERPRYAGGSA
jgi:hypothetical protein